MADIAEEGRLKLFYSLDLATFKVFVFFQEEMAERGWQDRGRE